jgi:hypothetical protein
VSVPKVTTIVSDAVPGGEVRELELALAAVRSRFPEPVLVRRTPSPWTGVNYLPFVAMPEDVPALVREWIRAETFVLGTSDLLLEAGGSSIMSCNDLDLHFVSSDAELLDLVRAHLRGRGLRAHES